MKKTLFYIFASISFFSNSQETISDVLKKLNTQSVPYISVQELAMPKTRALILDAREKNEFEVSHIKGAIHIGFEKFDLQKTLRKIKNKSQPIVVYCTLGVRSEDIAEKLKEAGYTDVKNLYGGIVEWKNNDFRVYDTNEEQTENVHVCNVYWSQWLLKGVKIYD